MTARGSDSRDVAASIAALLDSGVDLAEVRSRIASLEAQVEELAGVVESLVTGVETAAEPETRSEAQYVGVKDTAERFGVSEKTVRRLIASGDLPDIRVGELLRVHVDAVPNQSDAAAPGRT